MAAVQLKKRQHMAIIMWRNVAGITDIAISIQKVEPQSKKEGTPAVKGYIIRQICSQMDIKTE